MKKLNAQGTRLEEESVPRQGWPALSMPRMAFLRLYAERLLPEPASVNSVERPEGRLCLVKASVAIRRQIIQLVLTAQHLTTITR
ncbi:hypothetical protein PanABDRAFT_3552 [Pantoea sp. aB]|nr:hypothetical protein PanABDRAFT_3552 [Pantoea sp. aB]